MLADEAQLGFIDLVLPENKFKPNAYYCAQLRDTSKVRSHMMRPRAIRVLCTLKLPQEASGHIFRMPIEEIAKRFREAIPMEKKLSSVEDEKLLLTKDSFVGLYKDFQKVGKDTFHYLAVSVTGGAEARRYQHQKLFGNQDVSMSQFLGEEWNALVERTIFACKHLLAKLVLSLHMETYLKESIGFVRDGTSEILYVSPDCISVSNVASNGKWYNEVVAPNMSTPCSPVDVPSNSMAL